MNSAVLESPVIKGHWNYKAPSTPELASVVQSLTAINHYVYVVMEDAIQLGLDLLVVKKCLGIQFNTEQHRVHSRYMNAKKYIESGKFYRPYIHEVPDTLEEFEAKHFAHCKLGKDSYSITDLRNEIFLAVNALLENNVSFKEAINQVKASRGDESSATREAYQTAVDYYIGVSNSPLFSRHYDAEQHGKPKELTFGVQPNAVVEHKAQVPDVSQIVKQLTTVQTQPERVQFSPVQPVPPTDMADIVQGVIAERDKYKAESEKYKSEAEHFKSEYAKLSADMGKLKSVLANAGYAHVVK
jgi:uncharacterized protein YdhG (YjbR/CyaY superfamily)